MRSVLSLSILLTGLAVVASARATPNFPGAIKGDLGLASTPDCTLCHTDDNGGNNTITRPFGKNMRARGLVAYDTGSLSQALSLMESEHVDSVGGCLPDIEELKAGRDPNAPNDQASCDGGAPITGVTSAGEVPVYGCANVAPRSSSRGGSTGAALGPLCVGALVFLAARRRSKRRRDALRSRDT